MPGHRSHRQRMQGLQQQRCDPADEHRGISVNPADRPVLRKPALTWGVDQLAPRRALRPSDPLEDQPTQASPNQISGTFGSHPAILPRPGPAPSAAGVVAAPDSKQHPRMGP
jgi:hypothetical protein